MGLCSAITASGSATSEETASLCHIAIRVVAYRAQNGLTQFRYCQQFGHVWGNCKQPPRCLWCGGTHLHKECPEKGNTTSTQTFCNCWFGEGEKFHLANYRVCRHAKAKMQKQKPHRTPRTTTEDCSLPTLPLQAYPLRRYFEARQEQQQPQTHQVAVAGPDTMEPRSLRLHPNTNTRQELSQFGPLM
jgi:hypothetical protein